MAVLIQDDFGDANGTDISSRASAIGGQCSTIGGRIDTHAGAAYAAGGNSTTPSTVVWPNVYTAFEAEMIVDVKSQPFNHYVALGGRSNAGGTAYTSLIGFGDFGGDFLYASFDVGISNYLQAAVLGSASVGEHRLKWSAQGTLWRGFLDREEVVRVTNSSYASGRVALVFGNQATTTTGSHVKSLMVTDNFDRDFITFLGDSHFGGDGAGGNVGRANRVPNFVSNALISDGNDIEFVNLGVSGARLDQMLTAASQAPVANTNTIQPEGTYNTNYGRGAIAAKRTAAAKNIVVCIGGSNDIFAGNGDASAATVISRIEALRDAVQNDGQTFFYIPPPLADESVTGVGASCNERVADVVTWARANAASFNGGHIDYTADTALFDYPTSTYRRSDGIHWTAEGMARLANNFILPAVRSKFTSIPVFMHHYRQQGIA